MKKLSKIMLSLLSAVLLATPVLAGTSQSTVPLAPTANQKSENFQIVEDSTQNGVRHIKAVPSRKVCSSLIEFDIINGKIHNLSYTGGCNGNLKAISILIEGMSVKEAISKLSGVDCHGRGTSCTDQLAQILKSLK